MAQVTQRPGSQDGGRPHPDSPGPDPDSVRQAADSTALSAGSAGSARQAADSTARAAGSAGSASTKASPQRQRRHLVERPVQRPDRHPGKRRNQRRRLKHTGRAVAIFTAPFLVLFLVVYVAPIIYSVVQSLFIKQSDPLGLGEVTTHFAGLDNYREVLGDSEFWASMRRILAFGLVQVPVMVGIAVGLALLLDSAAARGVRIFRLIYFLPYAIPGVIAAVIWSYLYAPSLSPVAEILKALGLSVDFLGQSTVLWSMANVTTWCWTGYNMLIFLAALQAIPRDQYEAARIDGASEWRIAFRVKLPQIGPALVLSGTLSIIGTIQLFNEPKILSQVSTAVSSGYVPMMFAQHEAFMNNNINYAAAISVVIALIAGVLSLVFYRATNRRAQ